MKNQALLKAISAGRPRQVRLLLDAGSSITQVDDCGQTVLIRAVLLEHERNRDKILRLLLKRGGLVSKSDVVGRNAVMWACIYGRDTVLGLLIENADTDLDVNRMDINGQTALYHAVSSGSVNCVRQIIICLKKYDLSVDLPDFHGITPLLQAIRLGHDVCANSLVNLGRAKVGLGMNYPRDFDITEKWETQSLRNRVRTNEKTRILPLIKIKGNCSSRLDVISSCGSVSSYDSFTSTESDFSGKFSDSTSIDYPVVLDKKLQKYLNLGPGNGTQEPMSLTSFSTSLEANPSDDEVDMYSTPCHGNNNNSLTISNNLPKMYGLKQDQLSTSFRKAAIPLLFNLTPETTQCTLETEVSDVGSTKSFRKNNQRSDARKWNTLKKNLQLENLKRLPKTSDSRQLITHRLESFNSFHSEKSEDIFIPKHRNSISFPDLVEKTSSVLLNQICHKKQD